MYCIYHSRDLDGWMSAAIVKYWHDQEVGSFDDVEKGELTLIGWDYGDPIPEIPKGEQVVMTDISWPKEIMHKMVYDNHLIWIDHHVSAINDVLTEVPASIILGVRSVLSSACELTWQYFFPNKPIPEIVRLLGRYDCFGHKGTPEEKMVLEFQYGARQSITNPDEALMALKDNLEDYYIITKLLKDGQAIYYYLCSEALSIYSQRITIEFDGYFFAAVNRERFNPINFGINYHNDKANDIYYYDGFACFWYDGKKNRWVFSLYNDNGKVDCSTICKKRGGGGHKGAAGFITDKINEFLPII